MYLNATSTQKERKKKTVSRNIIAGNKAILKSIFILFFFFPICDISSRRAVKMPRSDILIQDLPRYIWHFRAAQLHLPLCLSASPATQTFILQRSVQNQTFSQLSFSPSSLPLEWTIPFSTTAQWLSFYFFPHFRTENVCLNFVETNNCISLLLFLKSSM